MGGAAMNAQTDSSLERIRRVLKRNLPMLRERYHIQSLGLFGSYVRREQSADSDLDLLVTFSEVPSLLRFVALENELCDLVGVQVDLVMRDALKPRLGRRILEEVVEL
jgi:predicted nucleotidyltransferase